MSKIYSFNSDGSGSYLDKISGILGVNTNGTWSKTGNKGYAWLGNGVSSKIDTGLAHGDLDLTGDITVEMYLNPKSFGGDGLGRILDNGKLVVSLNSGVESIGLSNNAAATNVFLANNSIILSKLIHVIFTREADGTTQGYLNSVISGISGGAATEDGTFDLRIGGRVNNSRFYEGYIPRIIIYNEVLTQSQINNLYKDFLRSKGTGSSIHRNGYPIKATNLSHIPNLVASYNFIPS